jgi:hypothetical protein
MTCGGCLFSGHWTRRQTGRSTSYSIATLINQIASPREIGNSGPALFDVLVTFINLFGEYGTNWGFSAKPELVFGQNSHMAPTLDALASIGLVTKLGNGFIWTEHIAPMMRASYHYEDWPEPASK